MKKTAVPVGLWKAMNVTDSTFNPRKPRFSFAKTKAKLAGYFAQNQAVRELCIENKRAYPRMHQSVQDTAWQLLMYYIKNWGKSTARNYEIRITYSYLRQALNGSCCIATLKNHLNKLLKLYRGFIKVKWRGGLGLPMQNTACLVLELEPEVLQFEEERHNQAVQLGQRDLERQGWEKTAPPEKRAAAGLKTAIAKTKVRAEKGQQSPQRLDHLIPSALATLFSGG